MSFLSPRRLAAVTAFTLIELLIVVAIIAILAAIAVPNFLEAQVRAKVSRAKTDMRTLATGLESYVVDHNGYPDVDRNPPSIPIKLGTPYSRAALALLSTPVSYLSSGGLIDPFAVGSTATTFYGYANAKAAQSVPDLAGAFASTGGGGVPTEAEKGAFDEHRWVLQSVGPDKENFAFSSRLLGLGFRNAFDALIDNDLSDLAFYYDPTNGTTSTGDIVRTGKGQLN